MRIIPFHDQGLNGMKFPGARPLPYRPSSGSMRRPPSPGPFGGFFDRIANPFRHASAIAKVDPSRLIGTKVGVPLPSGHPARVAAEGRLMKWIERKHPDLMRAASARRQLSGFGETGSFLDTLSTLGSKVLAYREQQKLLDLNIARARAGTPPLPALTPTGAASSGAYAQPTYHESLMDTIDALPLPVKIGAVGALGFLGWKLVSGRRGRR